MLLIQQENNGQTFDATIGQVFEIRLPENPTTGFRWDMASGKPAYAVIRDEFRPPQPARPGAPGEHTWELKALAAGDCEIELSYRRRWQPDDQPANTFRVRLHVTP